MEESELKPILSHRNASNNVAFGLLDPNDLNIPPHDHRNEASCPDRRACNQHQLLRVAIGMLNGETRRRADRIRKLQRDVSINAGQVQQFGSRKVLSKPVRENVLPNGGCDRQADGTANIAKHAQHGQDDGNMLMWCGGHDGNLVTNDDDARGEGEEDLAHDDVADVAVWLVEVDHQAQP